MPAGCPKTAAAAPEAERRLLDALLFSLILVAWAAALWCWLSHYATGPA